MASSEKRIPINLTAMAEAQRLPGAAPGVGSWGEARGGCSLEVCWLDETDQGPVGDGMVDAVYVVASGYGVLLCGYTTLECTAGDVLFVPGGQPHRFECPDGAIRIWRISALPRPGGTG